LPDNDFADLLGHPFVNGGKFLECENFRWRGGWGWHQMKYLARIGITQFILTDDCADAIFCPACREE
jgi:hypothetical protein